MGFLCIFCLWEREYQGNTVIGITLANMFYMKDYVKHVIKNGIMEE